MLLRFVLFSIILSFTTTIKSQEVVAISPLQAKSMMDTMQMKQVVIIDARDSTMYANAHLKGAVNIDAFNENVQNLVLPYIKRSSVIIYCTHTKRSDQLAEIFINSGFSGFIYKISDGISAWKDSGYPLEN
jgi:rhodanese-related sulfurtransferase